MRRRCASGGGISAERERIFFTLVYFVSVKIFIFAEHCAIHDGGVVVGLRTWRRRKRQSLFRKI